jgi:hypothetical protein
LTEENISHSSFLRRRLVLLAGCLLFLSACSTRPRERVWLQPPGWSRGQFLGTTASSNLIPLARDPEGNLYSAYLSDQLDDRLVFVSFDPAGHLRWELELPESTLDAGRSAELVASEGQLLAFWLDKKRVILQRIDPEGAFIDEALPISDDLAVSSYDIAAAPDGHLYLFSGGFSDEPGVYGLDLFRPGSRPVLIDPEGVLPAIAADEYGILHASWITDPELAQEAEIRYGSFLPGRLQAISDPIRIATDFTTTDEVEPPSLGLDRYHAYIFWTAVIHTGLRAGQIDSLYVSFPLIDTSDQHDGRLFFPMAYDLDYSQGGPPDGLSSGLRLPWHDEDQGSDQARELISGGTFKNETAAVFRSRVPTRSGQTQTQVSVQYLEMGRVSSYQLVTFTNTASRHPNFIVDDQGQMYLSWLEATDVGQYSVYVATTAPSYRPAWDALTSGDVREMALDTLFGMISGIILVPVTFLWLILPMLSLGLTSVLRRDEGHLLGPGHIVSLLLAAGIYWAVKLAIFPVLRTTVPFVEWIPIIPHTWYPVLMIGVPVVYTSVAAFLAVWLVHRSERSSPTLIFLIYGLLDGLFTVAITGGGLFGV